MTFFLQTICIGTNNWLNLQSKNENNITWQKQHFAHPPCISAAVRIGIESSRFCSAHEEDHSRLLTSQPKVRLYQLQEGITSEIPTNKIPYLFKTRHIRWIDRIWKILHLLCWKEGLTVLTLCRRAFSFWNTAPWRRWRQETTSGSRASLMYW